MAATTTSANLDISLEQVGAAAGTVWRTLDAAGPLPLAKLAKQTELPRELLLLALGWLAREDKLTLEGTPRALKIALR